MLLEIDSGASVEPSTKIDAPRKPSSAGAVPQAPTIFQQPQPDPIPAAIEVLLTAETPPQEPISRAGSVSETKNSTPAKTSRSGHPRAATHLSGATPNQSDEGQSKNDAQGPSALIGTIIAEARRYEDYTRARQRLHLQALATCRTLCDGDKLAAVKLYKNPSPAAALWLAPYEAAMAPLDTAISDQKKVLEKLAKQLPVWTWCKDISGVGPYMLARIVGAAGRPIGDYRSPSAVWKRFMLAVDDGKRQWKDASPSARAIVWNVGECIIKAQIRNPKGEDGKPVGERCAIGPLGQVYLDRREVESGKVETPGHIHNRSKRYMEKRFLRDLWRAWRVEAGE